MPVYPAAARLPKSLRQSYLDGFQRERRATLPALFGKP